MLAGVALSLALVAAAQAEGKIIGVSWSNFQEERWKTDEAAMKAALEAAGNSYISADAQSSAAKQLTDVEIADRAGRRRAHHPGAGLRGHRAGRREGCRRRHSGRRL